MSIILTIVLYIYMQARATPSPEFRVPQRSAAAHQRPPACLTLESASLRHTVSTTPSPPHCHDHVVCATPSVLHHLPPRHLPLGRHLRHAVSATPSPPRCLHHCCLLFMRAIICPRMHVCASLLPPPSSLLPPLIGPTRSNPSFRRKCGIEAQQR